MSDVDYAAGVAAVERAVDDPSERIRSIDLEGRELECYEAGFIAAMNHGHQLLMAQIMRLTDELAQANWDADRYYAEMCRRPAPRRPEGPSYTELCRIRGEHDRAERQQAALEDAMRAIVAA